MNLNKALKAMQQCEAWTNSVQAAALFARKEYGPELLAAMTKEFLDDLGWDEATQTVSVPESVGDPLMAAVEAWQPASEGEVS